MKGTMPLHVLKDNSYIYSFQYLYFSRECYPLTKRSIYENPTPYPKSIYQ